MKWIRTDPDPQHWFRRQKNGFYTWAHRCRKRPWWLWSGAGGGRRWWPPEKIWRDRVQDPELKEVKKNNKITSYSLYVLCSQATRYSTDPTASDESWTFFNYYYLNTITIRVRHKRLYLTTMPGPGSVDGIFKILLILLETTTNI